jgi:outer membrane immunogenic protein
LTDLIEYFVIQRLIVMKHVFVFALCLAAAPVYGREAANNFNGPFVGIQAGWQQDRQKAGEGAALYDPESRSDSGLAYGGQIGYDFRLAPSLVVGAEVALTGRTGSGVTSDGIFLYQLNQGRTVMASARFGYLGTPDDLFYVRGGYANARSTISGGGPASGSVSINREGYLIGAGYERILAQSMSARIEYGYSDLDDDKLFIINSGPDAVTIKSYSRHTITVGVNFRF